MNRTTFLGSPPETAAPATLFRGSIPVPQQYGDTPDDGAGILGGFCGHWLAETPQAQFSREAVVEQSA